MGRLPLDKRLVATSRESHKEKLMPIECLEQYNSGVNTTFNTANVSESSNIAYYPMIGKSDES